MTLFRKLAWLFHRSKKENDLRDELAFHLSEEGGADAARRELGNLTLVMESTRATWSWIWLDQLAQDLRYAARTMLQNKAFTALAALSLALGIGANTAIYSFLDALLLRSLPVADPQSLVVLNWHAAKDKGSFVMHGMSGSTWDASDGGEQSGIFPYPAFEEFQKNSAIFSSVFAHCRLREVRTLNLTIKGQSEQGTGVLVSGDYFRGLGVQPAAGRLLDATDDAPGAQPAVVVAHAFSEKYLGGAANAVGQTILLDNFPFTVAGVTPPEFFGVSPGLSPDVYLAIRSAIQLGSIDQWGFSPRRYLNKNDYWVEVMARLQPGVSIQQARATLAPEFHNWVASTAANDQERANLPILIVDPGAQGLSTQRRKFSQPLFILMTLVGLILALACANVANLLMARATARRREIALRLSLGAGRARILRQLLTESVLLASVGGVAGVLFAMWGIQLLNLTLRSNSSYEPVTVHAGLNWHVLAIAAGLSLLTGVLFGLAPAMQATRVDVVPALKESRSGEARGPRSIWKISASQVLIAGQIAVSVLLLVAAGLFARTLSNLESVPLGFNRDNILEFTIDARKAGHRDPEISKFYANLRDELARIPGVWSASLAENSLPAAGTGLWVTRAGAPPPQRGSAVLDVGPGFLTTMQVPLIAGRDFDERDHAGTPLVAIVNEKYVAEIFEGRNPLGEHLIVWGDDKKPARDMTIVGVVKNARYGDIRRDYRGIVYMPYDQGYPFPNDMTFALKTSGNPLRYVESVREIVHRADLRVPVTDITTGRGEVQEQMSMEITLARLCSAFALLALAIAWVGLYGTMSYSVARRTSEIGIRMALGAKRARVVWMVLREILILTAAGFLISIPAARSASKWIASLLYQMKPNDPWTLAAAAATLLGTALIAAFVPARRASRIDPMVALRHE